ncbi:hypothetical protein PM082_021380 [Marasmius tenuissimus]|nr:hypothetical protein PM082_021380 [Marasmius tenuissimus]
MHELAWAIVILIALAFVYSRNSSQPPFPPGPTGLPLLGVIRSDHPKTEAWKTYAEWGRLYSSNGLISFDILGRRILVVNSKAVADSLFTKRSANYNDRPFLTFACQIMRREKSLFLSSYNDRCKMYRRLMQQAFNPNSSQLYWNIQEDVGRKTIDRILQTPEKLVQHLRWNAGFVTMKVAYGYTIQDEDDHFVAIAEEASKIISAVTEPGKWLVDSVPILRYLPDWFPGAEFKKTGK